MMLGYSELLCHNEDLRMDTKFTPGPWRISSDPWHYDTLSVVTAGGERKGHPNRQMIIQVGGFAGPQEQEANARLIAAAPELLAALQELRYACTDKAEAMADAAISKAIGA